MTILSIDTCLQACSVAVLERERVLAHRSLPLEKGHAERLAPLAREVLAAADLRVNELERIAVTIGPGSFTGVRVGLAFARGLAIVHQIPVLGLSTLVVLAAAVAPVPGTARVVLIDARRGQVYGQVFADEGPEPTSEAFVLDPEQARIFVENNTKGRALRLVGTGARMCFGERVDLISEAQPDPVVLARLAMACPTPTEVPQALYLRAPDAKPAKRLL